MCKTNKNIGVICGGGGTLLSQAVEKALVKVVSSLE